MANHNKIVIIGGGIAGLSAANRLVDRGVKPILIEASHYPQQRICGEFLSYECLPQLEEWEILASNYIKQCRFIKSTNSFTFPLPKVCGSLARDQLEKNLYERAIRKGVCILEDTSVTDWKPDNVQLSTGEVLQADRLIIGTGKLSNQKLSPRYYAYKTHLNGIDLDDTLEMHCIPNGYLGLNTVAKGVTNVAILSDAPLDPGQYVPGEPLFEWKTGRAPEFGVRNNPSIPHVFWVGDAMGSIPPASGDGVAIGITSGCMAADYAMTGNSSAYEAAWKKTYSNRFFWATQLHRYLLKTHFAGPVMTLCRTFTGIGSSMFSLTRG